MIEKIKLYQEHKDNYLFVDKIMDNINELLDKNYKFFCIYDDKCQIRTYKKDNEKYIYIYSSLNEISKKDLEYIYIGEFSLKGEIIGYAKKEDAIIILNPNSLNYEIYIDKTYTSKH